MRTLQCFKVLLAAASLMNLTFGGVAAENTETAVINYPYKQKCGLSDTPKIRGDAAGNFQFSATHGLYREPQTLTGTPGLAVKDACQTKCNEKQSCALYQIEAVTNYEDAWTQNTVGGTGGAVSNVRCVLYLYTMMKEGAVSSTEDTYDLQVANADVSNQDHYWDDVKAADELKLSFNGVEFCNEILQGKGGQGKCPLGGDTTADTDCFAPAGVYLKMAPPPTTIITKIEYVDPIGTGSVILPTTSTGVLITNQTAHTCGLTATYMTLHKGVNCLNPASFVLDVDDSGVLETKQSLTVAEREIQLKDTNINHPKCKPWKSRSAARTHCVQKAMQDFPFVGEDHIEQMSCGMYVFGHCYSHYDIYLENAVSSCCEDFKLHTGTFTEEDKTTYAAAAEAACKSDKERVDKTAFTNELEKYYKPWDTDTKTFCYPNSKKVADAESSAPARSPFHTVLAGALITLTAYELV